VQARTGFHLPFARVKSTRWWAKTAPGKHLDEGAGRNSRQGFGILLLDGNSIDPRNPAEALRLGISCVHQEISLAPNLTVRRTSNVGREPTRFDFIRGESCVVALGVAAAFRSAVGPRGASGFVERVVAADCRDRSGAFASAENLMLDEPTSSLETNEVARLGACFETWPGRDGYPLCHPPAQGSLRYGDNVTVLRDGKWVATSR